MTQTSLSPKEFIQECFPPRLAAMCSEDAQEVCRKNNLEFVELIQPFCRPNAELISSDLTNHRFYMKNFLLHVTTIEQSIPPNPSITRYILHDKVSRAVEEFDWKSSPQIEIQLKDRVLHIPGSAPWFDLFREEYIRSFPFNDHEYIRDFLGCVFVVSTSVPDPVARVKVLMEQQVQYQANQKYPRWLGPNIFKFFIILDDCSAGSPDDRKVRGDSALHYFSSTYGETTCSLIQVNSAAFEKPITASLSNPWRHNLQEKTVFTNGTSEADSNEMQKAEHPLASGPSEQYGILKKTPETTHAITGALLSEEDAGRLRAMVLFLITRALIPYGEKLIRNLNELIISKKGIHRTLVSATRRIFGPSAPTKNSQKITSGSNLSQVVYVGEAVELQNRKVADLSFIFQMYDQAFQFYDSARRDYRNDQAWHYYATASEMCGLSVFLSPTAGFSTSNSRAFPINFLEDAIKSYNDGGKMTHQSVRATLFATEICKALHLYSEAATFFKSRFMDDFDLLHGIFLEQAAFCFLSLARPNPGRFCQHLIYAGHRYFKAVQRKLGILTYQLALRVLEGKGWNVAEDHIRMNIVRHSITLKMFDQALPHLRPLLTNRQSLAQQNLILRDLCLCSQIIHGGDIQELNIPLIASQNIKTYIGKIKDLDSQLVEVLDDEWMEMEEKIIASRKHSHPIFRHQQIIFSDKTDNRHHPVISVHEELTIDIPIQNLLGIPLTLSSIRLLYSFTTRDNQDSHNSVKTSISSSALTISPSEEQHLICALDASEPGSLCISAIQYDIESAFENPSEDVAPSMKMKVQQKFDIRGWRQNSTKAEKSGTIYAPDHRLDITVIPASGKIVAKWDNFPRSVLAGQVVRLNLTIENQGQRSVDHLALLSSHPDVFVFFNCPREQNIITLQLPDGKINPGEKISLSAVFIAPLCPDVYVFKSLLYYESLPDADDKDRKHKYRLWRLQHSLEVLPSVTVRGSVQPVSGSMSTSIVNLQLEHINQVQLKSVPFKIVEILSLNPEWSIRKLTGSNLDDGNMNAGEEMHLVLSAAQSDKKDVLSSFILSTSLDASDQNFIRAARTLTGMFFDGVTDQLVLRVLWKLSLMSDGQQTNVFGLRAIAFDKPTPGQSVPDICRLLKPEMNDPFISFEDHLGSTVLLDEGPVGDVVDWLIEFPSSGHISNSRGVNRISMKLHLLCSDLIGLEKVVHVLVEFRTAVRCFPIGAKKITVELTAGQSLTIPFEYCFVASGTYNLAEFVAVKALCTAIPELKVSKQQKPSRGQMLFSL